jgi:hypothetical protein
MRAAPTDAIIDQMPADGYFKRKQVTLPKQEMTKTQSGPGALNTAIYRQKH